MLTDDKLPRREFLKISSVVIAGTAASGLFHTESLFAAASDAAVIPLLSVGYVGKGPDAEHPTVRLGYASELVMGDPAFLSHSALVTLSSYSRRLKSRGQPNGVEIDAIYPAHGYTPDKYPRFRAWLAIGRDGSDVAASGARFTLPVTSTDGAQFVIHRLRNDESAKMKNGPAAPVEDALLRLSTGVESGTLKLQRGIYVVAFRESGSDDVPNWAGFTLVRGSNGALSIPNAPFSYMIMTIDYAN